MRKTLVILGALALLAAEPLSAAETAPPLQPGKPAGVKSAQLGSLWSAYAPALLFGALLAVTIGVNGSGASSNSQAVSTNYCCG